MTARVLAWPRHKWAHCTREDCLGCFLCDGGLACCVRCGGLEGSLPTDCPGEHMTEDRQDEVYSGDLDYRVGRGWVREPARQRR